MKKSWMAALVAALVGMSACNKSDDENPVNYTEPEMSVTVESVVTTEAALDDVVEDT